MRICLRRREFIAVLGGVTAWSLAVSAQQAERMRRIGVLVGGDGTDPVTKALQATFVEGLRNLGWIDGRNLRIDTRWYQVRQNALSGLSRPICSCFHRM